MPASDEPSSPDVSCRTCKSPEFKPVLISERFGVETFFCPECEQTWEKHSEGITPADPPASYP